MSTGSPASPLRPTFAQWLEGARPHTWPNAFAPVIAGTGAAAATHGANLGRAVVAAIVSWALIVGVNYANDYSDGIRGTDEDRSGPLRLVGGGIAEPRLVKYAAFLAFGVAGVAGFSLAFATSWWLVALGAVCILAAWFYTGGSNPYGYRGWGEVAVFVFFGLVAVLGTEFAQTEHLSWVGLVCAVSIGAMSSSVNVANNLRDIPTDSASGKITLAVKLGDARTRILYYILVTLPLIGSVLLGLAKPAALAGLVAAPLIWRASEPIRRGAQGKELVQVLGSTGRAMVIWSIVCTIALSFA